MAFWRRFWLVYIVPVAIMVVVMQFLMLWAADHMKSMPVLLVAGAALGLGIGVVYLLRVLRSPRVFPSILFACCLAGVFFAQVTIASGYWWLTLPGLAVLFVFVRVETKRAMRAWSTSSHTASE